MKEDGNFSPESPPDYELPPSSGANKNETNRVFMILIVIGVVVILACVCLMMVFLGSLYMSAPPVAWAEIEAVYSSQMTC